jgi:DNA-3-methyladenine glycosylase
MTDVKLLEVLRAELVPLPRSFYARDVVAVARDLIGAHIVRLIDGRPLIARVVECEAYRSAGDAASHAHRGRTARNRPMFGPPGHAYVYFIYGMHWMFNVVAHPPGEAGAVLIRAAEPSVGTAVMQQQRGARAGARDADLTNGPAKLAQALAITGALNDADLAADGELILTAGRRPPDTELMCGPRMRVPGDEEAKARPWRFWIHGNAFVSR